MSRTFALVSVVAAVATGMFSHRALGATNDSGPPAQAVSALTQRGLSHDQIYQGDSAQAVRALEVRGQAFNRYYHLGTYGTVSGQAARALQERSVALDRTYKLGAYADTSGSSFPWSSVEIGIAGTIGVILVAFAAAVGVRKRRTVIAV